jgi:regulator of sirC expression with transglutaminase-like and TPR domain
MSELSSSEIKALVSLLDDDDKEVLEHVSKKIISLGPQKIPLLENAWEVASNNIIQERLEVLIQKIHFKSTKIEFQNWINSEDKDLLEGALLVSKIQYPDLDENAVYNKIDKIKQSIWLELNSSLTTLEEVNVLNHVFYTLNGFIGEQTLKPDPDLAFIHKTLDTKKGNSISLGIIYLILAQKLDLLLYGINLPYHFILCASKRLLSEEELDANNQERNVLFYINPLNKGLVFTRSEIVHYLEQSKIKSDEKFFAPCNNIEIIKTLLYNQIYCFDNNGDKEKAQMFRILYELL